MDDVRPLLREYAENGSESAFRELVSRHVDLVYSAALRTLGGNASQAEDVSQLVFSELARKARGLDGNVILSGWLYRTTVHIASRFVRGEQRRRNREQEAATMHALTQSPDAPWEQVAPALDEALNRLEERDRNALVLRFFEKRDLRSVGSLLGLTDDGAQKCVSRALDKLRGLLHRRGITSTGAALSVVLLAQGVQAAPAALTAKLPGAALAAAAAKSGSAALADLGLAARWKIGAATAALIAAGVAAPMLWKQGAVEKPESQRQTPVPAIVSPLPAPVADAHPAPAPPPAAPKVGDLVAEAAAALRGGAQNVSALTKALNALVQIPPADLPAALTIVQSLDDAGAQTLLFKFLLGKWAEKQPHEALEYAREKLPLMCRVGGMEGILDAWGQKNSSGGIAWLQKSAGPSLGNSSLTATLYRTMASQDLEEAFKWFSYLGSPGERSYALRGMMEVVQSEEARGKALSLIGKITNDESRLQATRALVEHWAETDTKAVADWILSQPNAYERSRLMDSLGLVWLQREPKTAADWWLKHAPSGDTLTKIVNVWAHEDPNAAGEWLRDHAAGPQGDDARMTFARQVQEIDPVSSLAWAETISQPVLREATIDHIFRSWQQRSEAEAQQFLEKSKWPPERVGRLQQTNPPK